MLTPEYLITSLIVVLIPGTGVTYTVSTGLLRGWRAGIAASFGCTLGILPHLAASMFGLAALLHVSALAFELLKFAGVAYLLYLAWATWHDHGALRLDSTDPGAGRGVARRGFLLNILNPKLSIFFLAFMPQFVAPDSAEALPQLLLLSAVFMTETFVVFVIYALLAGAVRRHVLESPRVLGWLRRGFAISFAALGARLALSER